MSAIVHQNTFHRPADSVMGLANGFYGAGLGQKPKQIRKWLDVLDPPVMTRRRPFYAFDGAGSKPHNQLRVQFRVMPKNTLAQRQMAPAF